MDGVLQLLRDPIWQFIGVVISFIALVLTCKQLKRDTTKSNTLSSPTPLMSTSYKLKNTSRNTVRGTILWGLFGGFITLLVICIIFIILGYLSLPSLEAKDAAIAASATKAAQAKATASVITANPYPTYLPGKGTLVLYNLLHNESTGNGWQEGQDIPWGGACEFTNGAYHVSQSKENRTYNCGPQNNFSNFALEFQMTIIKGNCGGIFFRYDPSKGSGYLFEICLYKSTSSSLSGQPGR